MDCTVLRISHLNFWLALLALAVVPGCGKAKTPAVAHDDAKLKSPADPLTAGELDLFLRIVRAHPQGRAPEFIAPEDDDPVIDVLSAADLVQETRARFRKLYDPRRQGTVWGHDAGWSKVLAQEGVSPARFAALVECVSCAVTRIRLDTRTDVDLLARRALARTEDLVARMDRIDQLPLAQRTGDSSYERTQAAIQLGRTVALLEFAELLKQVPAESRSLVRKYAPQLKPILSTAAATDPFAELQEWESQTGGIQPAGYGVP